MTTRCLPFAGAALLLVAQPAQADWSTRSFRNACVPGSLRVCASVVVRTIATSSGTKVSISMRNLQGSFTPPGRPPVPSAITRFRLQLPSGSIPDDAFSSPVTVTTSGTATSAGGGSIDFYQPVPWIFASSGNMFGCETFPTDLSGELTQTCGEGWITLSFDTSFEWDASDVRSLQADFYAVVDGELGYWEEGQLVEVVPEPMTIVLLGSGLAGLGAAAKRRRRAATPPLD